MMSKEAELTIDNMRQQARELHVNGRPIEAINIQIKVISVAAESGNLQAEDYHRLGVMLFSVQDFPNAVVAFEKVYKQEPIFHDVSLNLGLCLIRVKRYEEAISHLKIAEKQAPDDLHLLDGMAEVCWKVGDQETSRYYGEKSLSLKDMNARKIPPKKTLIFKSPPPPFRSNCPDQNVISFSLFGDQERYLAGAVKNVTAAKEHYPGWRCRFYCDDRVPKNTLLEIAKAGGDIKMLPRPQRFSDGLFWRFLVADDPSVVRFLIRDCDSIVNIREKCAVNEWLGSGKYFHIMRDNYLHTDLMLAGMWGGVAGVLPPLTTLLEGFSYRPQVESRRADQHFLGRVVWPMVKENCLIHDRIYRVFNAIDFPPGADLPPGRVVGDNDFVFARKT